MSDKSIECWRTVIPGPMRQGRYPISVPLPVSSKTVVAVSASEFDAGGRIGDNGMGAHRKSGNADVWVSNIATHGTTGQGDGRVDFVLHIDDGAGFDNAIYVCVDITRLHPDSSHPTLEIAWDVLQERWG